ncbi:MAG: maltose/maltodextrin ABC transporter substrate-binding protein MalE [Bdellovibrionales bacterium]|nr:maltose/maltodextrin ABC transporter substrate-binding protein MalE [Bdellovibrionales bacterium]
MIRGVWSPVTRLITICWLLLFSGCWTLCPALAKIPSTNSLNIWTSSENVKKALEPSVAQFQKDFNVSVTIDVLNKDLTTQFKTAAISSKGPDILCWAHDVVGELAESGLIEPLNVPPDLKNEFLPVALKAFTYKNRLYGYPYDLEAVALIYNKKFVSEAPKNLTELVELAKSIQSKNKNTFGFLFDINNLFFTFPILSSNGGYIFKDNDGQLDVNDIGINNIGAIKAGEFLHSLVKQGVVPPSTDRNIAFNKMKAGELAFTIDGPWALNDLRKSGISYGISPIPPLYGGVSRPFVGAHGFIVRRSSPNKYLAKELIEKYLVSKTGIHRLFKEDPRGPSRQDVLNELAGQHPDLMNFMESARVGIPMPNVPEMGSVWVAVGGALSLINMGKSSVNEALTQAQRQIENNVSKSQL